MGELHGWEAAAEHLELLVAWHSAHGRHATALTALNDALGKAKELPARKLLELRIKALEALGWDHWVAHDRALLTTKYPPGFPAVFSRA